MTIDDDLAPGFEDHQSHHIVFSKAGFTTVVSVRFGPDGLLYVLELSDFAGDPAPGKGKVVRVKHSGAIEEVITGLAVPTAMTFGPDGHLYVSNLGAAPAGCRTDCWSLRFPQAGNTALRTSITRLHGCGREFRLNRPALILHRQR